MGESSRNGRVRVSYNLTPDAEYSLLQLILYVLSFVTVLLIFLYTPAGLETRPLSTLRSYGLVPLFLAGTILDFASLILIFKKPRIAAITGIIAAIEYVFLAPGDQAQFFFVGVPVPVGITINEIVALIASIVVLLFAPMVYLANRKSLKPSP